MTMYGVDISNWQRTTPAGYEFYIIKATEGVGYKDPRMEQHTAAALKQGAGIGFYHYARPDLGNSAQKEAAYFLTRIQNYIGSAVLALDFEGKALQVKNAKQWALDWLEYVYQKTGVRPMLYVQGSAAYIAAAAYHANFGIWAASAASYYTKAGARIAIQQNVYNNIDHDIFYGGREAWKKYGASGTLSNAEKKDNTTLAYEVISGKWGNGITRRMRLTAAGYNYQAVQRIVNRILLDR